jgi:hypothetical protein
MSSHEKVKFIRLIEGSDLNISTALTKHDVARSTYCRWRRKLKGMGLGQ